MTRPSFPEIPATALKNHGEPERVERVWRRLTLDLSGGAGAPRSAMFWRTPLVLAAVFGLGVLVGVRIHVAPADLVVVAEPQAPAAAPGAGPALGPEPQAPERPGAAPAPKRPRATRLPPRQEAVFSYTEGYRETTGLGAGEPPLQSGAADWEKLAEAGEFRAAQAALERGGGFERVSERASAAQLLVLADIARALGSREQAAEALKRVLSTYDSAPEAPLAAWTLGNLLEQAGDRVGAAEAYATYRRLSPTGDFAEDAAARQVDAAIAQGNLELGTRSLEEYAQHFPRGRRLAELRQRLLALSDPADVAAPNQPDADGDDAEPPTQQPAAPPATGQ